MSMQKPKPLVEAFGGNPPDQGGMARARILGVSYSRENAAKVSPKRELHRRENEMFGAANMPFVRRRASHPSRAGFFRNLSAPAPRPR